MARNRTTSATAGDRQVASYAPSNYRESATYSFIPSSPTVHRRSIALAPGRLHTDAVPRMHARKEAAMRKRLRAAMVLGWFGLACVFTLTIQAQTSTAMAGDAKNSRPTSAAAKSSAGGQFTLPYEVECAGIKLAAGQYSLSVEGRGKSQTIVLTRAGQSVRLQAKSLFPSHRGSSRIIVRRTGTERRLEAVYLEKLRLVLYLDSVQIVQVANGDPYVEQLPIS